MARWKRTSPRTRSSSPSIARPTCWTPRRPDWTVEAAYQQRGSAYTNMFSVGVSIPLAWDAPNRQSREVEAKRAQAEEVAARRDETLRAHRAEVEAMIEEWRAGRERRA